MKRRWKSFFEDLRKLEAAENLLEASRSADFELASMLAGDGVDLQRTDAWGHAPLAIAAWNGDDRIVSLLIDAGAMLDHRDEKGATALIAAAKRSYYAEAAWWGHANESGAAVCLRLLIDAGAKIDAADSGGALR